MAFTFDVETKRGNFFKIDPNLIVMKEEGRGRHIPPTEAQIIERAISLYEYGQLQPVQVRKVQGVPHLILGFTRVAAARLLREGFVHEDTHYHVPNFLVTFLPVEANEKDAFFANVVENAARNQTTPIDDAHNQKKCRQFGKSDKEIALMYGCSLATVHQTAKLLNLSDEIQALVHNGDMAVSAALDLLSLKEEDRIPVIEAATLNGKVAGQEVRRQVRDKHLADTDQPDPSALVQAPKTAPAKKVGRSVKEIREFFAAATLTAAGRKKSFAEALTSWVNGEITDGTLLSEWEKL